MTLATRVSLLKFAGALTTVFGLFYLLALVTPLSGLFDWLTGILILDTSSSALDVQSTRFYVGICAGLLVGLGVFAWIVATDIFEQNPSIARKLVLGVLISWFVVDSLGCVFAGAYPNILVNLVFLAVFYAPFRGLKAE